MTKTNFKTFPGIFNFGTPPLKILNLSLKENEIYLKLKKEPITDTLMAKLIKILLNSHVLYCESLKSWFLWTGKKWKPDKKHKIILYIQYCLKIIENIVLYLDNINRTKTLSKIFKYEDAGCLFNVIKLLQPEFSILIEEFDTNPYLLNLKNGILDLKTFNLKSFDSKFIFQKTANVSYNLNSLCPLWEKTLEKYFLGDESLINYFQKILGFSLVGEQLEQKFFILYGKGANGKSTILNVLREILNDYCGEVPIETFLSSKNDNNRFSTYLIEGKRLIFCIEPDQHLRLKEGTIKALTGGDPLIVERKYQNAYQIKPQCTIFLACNNLPRIKGTDYGIWRRVKEIPFHYRIQDSERISNFDHKLLSEKTGILNWILKGWKKYQIEGLKDPEIIISLTEDYKDQEDDLKEFYDIYCQFGINFCEKSSILYEKYKFWCSSYGNSALSNKNFSLKLENKGLSKVRKNSGIFWEGIKLKE